MLATAVCLCALVCAGAAGRALVVFPVPRDAHGTLGDALVKTLLESHYEVTYVSVYPKKIDHHNLTYVDISSVLEHDDVPTRSANDILKAGPRFAQDALQHEAVKQLLFNSTVTFDAVISMWYYSGLLAPLAALYECPLVWYTPGDVSWQTLKLVHEEPSAAYSVDPLSGSLPALPFTARERLYQLGMQVYMNLWAYYTTHVVEIPAYDAIYRTPFQLRKRLLPPYLDAVYNASLLLVNAHAPLGQALPMPRNAKLIGGHHIQEPIKALPATVKAFLDKSHAGAIFIDLGELQQRLPKKQQKQLLDVLGELEQRVLWRASPVEYQPRNVRVVREAARLSVLSHPNVKLFITDGSMSSLMEAARCGVPVVAVPTGDQFVNVDLAVSQGLGRRVDFTKYLPWHLEGAIAQILRNESYNINAQHASVTFKQRITPANAELLFWLDLVISTRGAPHLRSPALQVPTLERHHADLWVLLVLALWFLSKVLKVIQVHLKEDLVKKNQ